MIKMIKKIKKTMKIKKIKKEKMKMNIILRQTVEFALNINLQQVILNCKFANVKIH